MADMSSNTAALVDDLVRAVSLRCHSHPGEERRSATERAATAKQSLLDALSAQAKELEEAREVRDLWKEMHAEQTKIKWQWHESYLREAARAEAAEARVAELEEALRICANALDGLGNASDAHVSPEVWRLHDCEHAVTRARSLVEKGEKKDG